MELNNHIKYMEGFRSLIIIEFIILIQPSGELNIKRVRKIQIGSGRGINQKRTANFRNAIVD